MLAWKRSQSGQRDRQLAGDDVRYEMLGVT
jgi:hypothetical protein